MKNEEQILSGLETFLRFASVSADPAHDDDCRACAVWLTEYLQNIGFTTECIETAAHPCVFAVREGNPAKPVVLFYGHYDVQPVDPPEQWHSPPFGPQIRDGRIYARGAQDNKGQCWFVISAIEQLIKDGADLPTIKILIEGDEESGSEGLLGQETGVRGQEAGGRGQEAGVRGQEAGVRGQESGLGGVDVGADYLLVCDTVTVSSGRPTIILGLRGLIHLEFALDGPQKDLHSGVHGGLAPNPLNGLAALLASLWREDGSIAIEGFYDGIHPPDEAEQKGLAELDFSDDDYRRQTGVLPLAGERGRHAMERLGFRPSLDVNGLQGGYAGAGPKTVIPATASAKLSCRLAAGQVPEDCLQKLKAHLAARVPAGLQLRIVHEGAIGAGFRLPLESKVVRSATSVLDTLGMGKTAYLWEGASIPVIPALAEAAGAQALLAGFGQEEDNIHAPNESFALERLRLGYRFVYEWLGAVADPASSRKRNYAAASRRLKTED